MSLADATRIVTCLGPCTIALDRAGEAGLAQALTRLGCIVTDVGDGAARAAVTRAGPHADVAAPVGSLVVIADDRNRMAVETPLFAKGWSRHPGGMIGTGPGDWSPEELPRLSFYRRGGSGGLLARGYEADAGIARLAAAAEMVRSGDRVLVGGADAEAGEAMVRMLSRADSVEAAAGDAVARDLAARPPASFDAIILAGTPAALIPLLDRAGAALKHDGRLLLAWCGDGGAALHAGVAERLIVERTLGQHDGGALLVCAADPLAGTRAPYRHPAFHRGEGDRSVLVDFAAAYDNPHLYRAMVQIGERIGDDLVLARLAECVLEEAGEGSADRGAAIAVLGYRVLDLGATSSIGAIDALIDRYLAATRSTNAPHVIRWRLSLLFLGGRLAELAGSPALAIERFHAASLADWAGFSPILATKAVAAAFHEARLHVAASARDAAIACFRRGLDTALAAAAAPHAELIGSRAAPVPFYLQEMAEIMDMGGQCAVALGCAHLLDRDPGLFWRQVDVKRFGLLAWADGLQREQARLRG